MKTPKYIEKIEEGDGIMSLMEIHSIREDIIVFLDKKLLRVWERGFSDRNNKIIWEDVIYKTNQKFFIHVSTPLLMGAPSMTIYYKSEQLNELKIFINQLNKQIRNGTTDNATIKGEN